MNGKVLIVDESRCTGCLLCALACSARHTGEIRLDRAHIQIWRTANSRYVPLTCHHCEVPSCALACPTKACHWEQDALRVVIEEQRCIGCRTCVVACPFSHAHYDPVARVSTKCDYCDGDPVCVQVCEPGAIQYVYADEDCDQRRRQAPLVRAMARRDGPPLSPDATRCIRA